jgi:hypothetical protein
MAVPKNFRNNLNINPSKIGVEKRQELFDGIVDHQGFLPRGVMISDMDSSVIDEFKTNLGLTLNGVNVPVIFLTIQRWSQFTKTWDVSDIDKNIKLPFVTIVRKPDPQEGTNQAGLWNIPGERTWTIMKVPTFDGARKGVDLYQIPQPTAIDLIYEVRFFSNKMVELNEFHEKMKISFNARQYYISPKGHPMPLTIENNSDESNIQEFSERRYYQQMYEIKLAGYLLDEKEYKVIPSLNRALLSQEVEEDGAYNRNILFDRNENNNVITYTFVFNPSTIQTFNFTCEYDLVFNSLINISNISRIIIRVDGVSVFDGTVLVSPININQNQVVTISISKGNLDIGRFQLVGNAR